MSNHTTMVGSGPALVLAHGAGGGVRANFTGLLDRGSAGAPGWRRTLIATDYPGAGRAPVRHDLDLAELADVLVQEAVALGHDRFPVLGLSLGSAVAVTAALRHPERVTGLVLTVGFAHAGAQLQALIRAWRGLADRPGDLAGLLFAVANSPATLAAVADRAIGAVLAEVAATIPPGHADHAALVGRVDLRSDLSRIAVPTMVVLAGEDRLVPREATLELTAIRDAELLELPSAGHIFTPDEDEVWAGAVADFLRNHGL